MDDKHREVSKSRIPPYSLIEICVKLRISSLPPDYQDPSPEVLNRIRQEEYAEYLKRFDEDF